MKTKLILKLSVLLGALVLVLAYRNFLNSGEVTAFFNTLFSTKSAPKISWCADHVVDVVWANTEVPAKLQKLDMATLRDNYCELNTENIQGLDLDQVKWSLLAESRGATGIKTILEWNKQLGVFRSGGLPFKSSNLSRELVDK